MIQISAMETPDLQTQDVEETRPTSSDPQGKSVLSEPGTPGPDSGVGGSPAALALIEFRRQQLNTRRALLLNMQLIKTKAKRQDGSSTEELIGEDSELEAIEKELQDLQERKEAHQEMKYETPQGGIFILPPPQLAQEEVTSAEVEWKTPTSPPIPVDSLSTEPAVTLCPSCNEIITTETTSTVSEVMWALCCLTSMLGCVAGCCLIPFLVDNLKNIHHKCPRCQAAIRTHQPL